MVELISKVSGINSVTNKDCKSVTLQHQTFSKIPQGNCDILKCDEPAIKRERHKYQLPCTFSLNSHYSKERRCSCGCMRALTGRKIYFDFSCRKRAERLRLKNA